jgi:hypothetical protein
LPTSPNESLRSESFWPRVETWLVVLIAIHSFVVALFLMFLTRWGAAFGGWGEVVGIGYLLEYFRDRGVTFLLTTKVLAVLFLASMMVVAEPAPWAVPLSGIADASMALAVYLVHRKAQPTG